MSKDECEEQKNSEPNSESEEQKRDGFLDIEKVIQEADTHYLNQRSEAILEKLNNTKSIKLEGGERVRLMIELRKIYCKLFSYNDQLMEYIMNLFAPAECFAFLEMMETQRPVTIRVNSLKTQKAALIKSLIEKGVNVEPLDEVCKMAFKINLAKVPMGATPEYLAGHYMLQSAASMLPVRALAPQPGECILDLAAAPGGKTTHIGQIMKNKGVIVANDSKKERTKALFYNCQRMGLTNVIITNFDGRKFPSTLKKFDRVLLDAPCTGLGVISRDQSIKVKRNVLDIYRAAHLQRELIRKAVDMCKVGGYVVYSTCSFAVEENEAVVDYICRKRFVKIVDTGLEIESKAYMKYKENRYNDRVKYCVRVFPHVHNLDGFFIAKLLKTREGVRGVEETKELVDKSMIEEEENKEERTKKQMKEGKRDRSKRQKKIKHN
jgi:ribosomal RNA methyltransferase Nop2